MTTANRYRQKSACRTGSTPDERRTLFGRQSSSATAATAGINSEETNELAGILDYRGPVVRVQRSSCCRVTNPLLVQ